MNYIKLFEEFPAKSSNEEFITKAKEVHGNKYDYSKVKYIHSKTPVKIFCPLHNNYFNVRPDQHLQGQGCNICSGAKFDKNDFISKAKKVHGNKYDYSKVNYINTGTHVKIKCNKCNKYFLQAPRGHLSGKGCPYCGGSMRLNKEDFISRAKKIHDDKYDYSKINYINNNTSIKIKCNRCNKYFLQRPYSHLEGRGCPYCSGRTLTEKDFIQKANIKHNKKYNYSKIKYINSSIKVDIICPNHGIFSQSPTQHLQGHGCPMCKESKGEKITSEVLKSFGIKYITQYKFNDCISARGRKLIFDFYLPDYNICIEYNGEQHYKLISRFADQDKFEICKQNDEIKKKYCLKNKIKLIIIPYTQKDYYDISDFLEENGLLIDS